MEHITFYLADFLINNNTTHPFIQISKIVKRYKLSEKHFWRLKVQSLCRLGAHTALSKLAAEKKSPIGFKPFAVGCIKYALLLYAPSRILFYMLIILMHKVIF